MSHRSPTPTLRPATPSDVPLLLELSVELARYEGLADAHSGSEELLARHLFGDQPAAEAVVAELAGEPAGYALFFKTFSTFLTRPGIWLEDIFVREPHRGAGIGRSLLAHVATLAVERGCGRVEWSVLNWNEPALRLYRTAGAEPMDGWTAQRLEGAALERFATE